MRKAVFGAIAVIAMTVAAAPAYAPGWGIDPNGATACHGGMIDPNGCPGSASASATATDTGSWGSTGEVSLWDALMAFFS